MTRNESAADSSLVLVGTQKGLFRVTGGPGRWHLEGPLLAGQEVRHAWMDLRLPGRGYAAVDHPVWGSHIYRSDDDARTWASLPAAPSHPPGTHEPALRAVWYLAPADPAKPECLYAGIDPAGLFRTDDGGATWHGVPGLNDHPTRPRWEPSRGGFSVHSIQQDAGDPDRWYCGVSAGGAFRSDDGARTWHPINHGVRAENRPERYPETGQNLHRLLAHPARAGRLYRQCYNGVYRSDDGGMHWIEISEGLPSDFGYPVSSPPDEPDTLYVVPVDGNHLRTAAGGRLRVYRTRDAGASWEALTAGLPQEHAYVTVLREALHCGPDHPSAQDGAPVVAMGTSGGHLFISPDGGERWESVAGYLPRILCTRVIR